MQLRTLYTHDKSVTVMYKQGKDDNLINIECLECIYEIINAWNTWNVNYVWFVDDNLINIECLECIYEIINAWNAWNVNYVWFVLFQLAKQDRVFKENVATFRFFIIIRFVKIMTISVFFGDL